MTDKGVKSLVKKIQKENIKILNLSNNDIRVKGTLRIAQLLRDRSFLLQELNLENNRLEDRAVVKMVQALILGNGLVKLNLTKCNIGHPGAVALSELMASSTKLRELYLGWNKIAFHRIVCRSDNDSHGLSSHIEQRGSTVFWLQK